VHTAFIIREMMEAVRTSETSIYFKENTRCYIPESRHLHAVQVFSLCHAQKEK